MDCLHGFGVLIELGVQLDLFLVQLFEFGFDRIDLLAQDLSLTLFDFHVLVRHLLAITRHEFLQSVVQVFGNSGEVRERILVECDVVQAEILRDVPRGEDLAELFVDRVVEQSTCSEFVIGVCYVFHLLFCYSS
jgi:hypothetical protein